MMSKFIMVLLLHLQLLLTSNKISYNPYFHLKGLHTESQLLNPEIQTSDSTPTSPIYPAKPNSNIILLDYQATQIQGQAWQ